MLKFRSGFSFFLTVIILVIVGLSFWLKKPSSVLDDYLAASPPPPPDNFFVGEEIVPPIPLPEFDLINFDGTRITGSDFKGRYVLLSFAYTSCPDSCPVLFGRFLSIQDELGEAIGRDLELVFITVDPEVDTPERLQAHGAAMKSKWYFLTEDLSIMQPIWKLFGMQVEKEGALVGHTNVTYLIDTQGLVRVKYFGLPPVSVFLSDIQQVLAGN